jgi:single-strand DNA-binding protein
MGYLNNVLIIGRLGQDPEKRVTPSGHSIVNISVATTEKFKNQAGEKQERTEWHRIVLWNRLAEIVEQYTKKGSQIYIEGALQTREWQDKDGNKRYSTDIIGRFVQLLDSKP